MATQTSTSSRSSATDPNPQSFAITVDPTKVTLLSRGGGVNPALPVVYSGPSHTFQGGPVVLPGDPTAALQAVTKQYADAFLTSPVFLGDPHAPTPPPGDNDTSIATTAFVTAAVIASGAVIPSNVPPLMDGIAAPGLSALYSRGDHVHPSDTSKANASALGTMAAQNANAVAITGGTINGTVIGGTAPATGNFTNVSANGVVALADGTVTNPGVAFASEPGLGWYRQGASALGIAAQGTVISYVTATNPTITALGLIPRAAGLTNIELRNHPGTDPGTNQLLLQQNANGSASIVTAGFGTFTRGNLTLDAPQVLYNDGTVAAPNIAFASEPGLGFWRNAAGTIRMAVGGGDAISLTPLPRRKPRSISHRVPVAGLRSSAWAQARLVLPIVTAPIFQNADGSARIQHLYSRHRHTRHPHAGCGNRVGYRISPS